MPIQTRGDRNGDTRAEDRGLLPLGSDCTGELGSGSHAYRAGGCPARRSRSIRAGITSDDAGWSSKVVAAVSRCYYFSWNQASRGTWDHDPRSFVFKGRCKHAVAEMVVPAPWARGQTTFPTVRVNCAHEALRRRDVAVRHPATGPPICRRPRKGALRA